MFFIPVFYNLRFFVGNYLFPYLRTVWGKIHLIKKFIVSHLGDLNVQPKYKRIIKLRDWFRGYGWTILFDTV